MRFGQEITIGLRVPPRCDATCLVHWNGVLAASAQPTGMFGSVSGPPIASYFASRPGRPSWMPLRLAMPLTVPSSPPSAEAPLSPTM